MGLLLVLALLVRGLALAVLGLAIGLGLGELALAGGSWTCTGRNGTR